MSDLGYPTDINSLRKRMEAIEGNSDYCTFLAILEGEVVGMIGARLVRYYEGDGVLVQISALVVKEDFQERGIGKELVKFIEVWAREKGSTSLYLTSGIKPERVKAHEFYKRNGFKIDGYRFIKEIE